MNTQETIFGYPITTNSTEETVSDIVKWIKTGANSMYFVCANPHSLEVARGDYYFEDAIKNADIIVPDGVGIVLASKILGGNIRSRVTGSDIFYGLSDALNRAGGFSYFFLGSTDENLNMIKDKMQYDFPNIKIVGTYSPPFKHEFNDNDNEMMIEVINSAKPNVLWVGMTAPKQEKWVYNLKERLDVQIIGAIGAVFDFYTGNVKRSHPIFQKMGLEWLPRLLREPSRLWRRNLASNPNFLLRVIHTKFKEILGLNKKLLS